MESARSVRNLLKVNIFTLNTKKEIISKITREVLSLFKVEITGRRGEADYVQLSVVNHRLPVLEQDEAHDGALVRMQTTLMLFTADGSCQKYQRTEAGKPDELERAAVNRTIKLNLYRIFCQELGMPQAPWGILHGVRPTKIVHRWITYGLDEAAIVTRLMRDFACSEDKARVITPMAFRQLPFLNSSYEKTVSVYVGIPFCLTRCLYCSFPSNILPPDHILRQFMTVLQKDIEAAKAAVREHGFTVQNIYVGGGTPTALPDAYFASMLQMVYNSFYGPQIVEFTVEAGRPDSITPAKIETMKRLQVSRVSVNPQTMQETNAPGHWPAAYAGRCGRDVSGITQGRNPTYQYGSDSRAAGRNGRGCPGYDGEGHGTCSRRYHIACAGAQAWLTAASHYGAAAG